MICFSQKALAMWGRRGSDLMVVRFTTTLYQSVLITTNAASSNAVQLKCTRYNIM